MPAKINKINYYIRVEPDTYWYYKQDDKEEVIKETCEEIIQQISRHIDSVKNISLERETEKVCEYCERFWTEDDLNYNGGCCSEDENNAPKNIIAPRKLKC